jgi:hypothetical protein
MTLARLVFVLVALAACHRREHDGRAERDKHRDDDDEDEALYAVPVPGCTCSTDNGTIAIHAPRTGKFLWHFGFSRSKRTDEISVFSGGGQHVMSPGQDARLLMACEGDVVAVLREDQAAAWRLKDAHADAKVIWSAKLPAPIDATAIDAPLVDRSAARVGCGHPPTVTNGAFAVHLKSGNDVTLSIRDGSLR